MPRSDLDAARKRIAELEADNAALRLNGLAVLEASAKDGERIAELTEALRNIVTSGVQDIDPRLDYVEVQVDRKDWQAVKDALRDPKGGSNAT